MQIRAVADVPDAWPALASVMQTGWPDWYGPGGQGDALCDLRDRSGAARPWGWVAIAGGAPVGTVALYDTSYGAQGDEGPWLTGW